MASISRRIRRNMATRDGKDVLDAYERREIGPEDRDELLLYLTPSPRGFTLARKRVVHEHIRVTKARAEQESHGRT